MERGDQSREVGLRHILEFIDEQHARDTALGSRRSDGIEQVTKVGFELAIIGKPGFTS